MKRRHISANSSPIYKQPKTKRQIKHSQSFPTSCANFKYKDPEKFLQPIDSFNVYGIIFLTCDVKNSAHFSSGFNTFKKIVKMERFDDYVFTFSIDTDYLSPPPDLLIERLRSLSNKDAYLLSETIEKFCLLQKIILQGDFKSSLENLSTPMDIITCPMLDSSSLFENGKDKDMNSLVTCLGIIDEFGYSSYARFIKRVEEMLLKLRAKPVIITRSRANIGETIFKTHHHVLSNEFLKLVCPSFLFFMSTIFNEGYPQIITSLQNYFQLLFNYVELLCLAYKGSLEPDKNDGEKNIPCIIQTYDGYKIEAFLTMNVELFGCGNMIEVIRSAEFLVNEEDSKFLVSEKRSIEFMDRIKKIGDRNNDFVCNFYPRFIPRNTVFKNQTKVCKFKIINGMSK